MQDGEGTGRLQASKHRNEEGKAPSVDDSAAAPLSGLAPLEHSSDLSVEQSCARAAALLPRAAPSPALQGG